MEGMWAHAYLWCQIIWCPAKSIGHCVDDLGETEISDLDVAICVEQDVFGLQVAVYDVV